LDDLEQFWVLFTWQQRFESLALGFESSSSPAKLAKRFESSNLDSRIRLTTTVGLIHKRVDFWVEHFCPDAYVRGILDHGYKAPINWEKIPEVYEEPVNKSVRENYDFVPEEVARLVESGQVVKRSKKPRCVIPLSLALKRKDNWEVKRRLVLDLSRSVNLDLDNNHYGMTTLQDAINATRKGDFQVVFDLKLAFHHIRLHASMYELMGFKITDKNGVVTYYCFVVLVFGLKVTDQVFGRMLKPVICFLIQIRLMWPLAQPY
jgi:hypothetical protein